MVGGEVQQEARQSRRGGGDEVQQAIRQSSRGKITGVNGSPLSTIVAEEIGRQNTTDEEAEQAEEDNKEGGKIEKGEERGEDRKGRGKGGRLERKINGNRRQGGREDDTAEEDDIADEDDAIEEEIDGRGTTAGDKGNNRQQTTEGLRKKSTIREELRRRRCK
ncbi:hypothetical protein ACLOJK_005579 [Asimina triloba]